MPRLPVTDFFGTRLEPHRLLGGLRAAGLDRFALVLRDDEAVLRLPAGAGRKEVRPAGACGASDTAGAGRKEVRPAGACGASDTAGAGRTESAQRALTWLRSQMSPLLPCRSEPAARGLDGRLLDRRRRPWQTVALAEVWDETRGRAAAEARLRRRLGAVRLRGWRRPGGPQGVRPALILAASRSPQALDWLERAMADGPWVEPEADILLDGLEWAVARRPTIAAEPAGRSAAPVLVDLGRCRRCGLCAAVCPAGRGPCLRCFDCVEACPQDARRPRYGASSATWSRALRHRPGWLSRLRGEPGPPLPALFPPSYLLPRPGRPVRPRRILGLSVTTMQEHAAALVEDGAVLGAVEEERLARVRHYGFQPEGRPGVTIAADPTLCLEEVLCRRSIGALLAPRGLTLDDMDLIAVNGIPARYRAAYSPLGAGGPIPALRCGRVAYLPHHLCHAASAWRVSGLGDSWVLTVDGRGDRETAAVFRASRGRLRQVRELLSLDDRSIGGVYETVTRLLGFGAHGQGSVMALASFGQPDCDLSDFLSWRGELSIHEAGLAERFAALARAPGSPLTRRHQDLAASLQAALEEFLLAWLRDCGVRPGAEGLCLAGGVALNCRLNSRLRDELRPRAMFVQPGANDAGTALGAALEAAAASGTMRRADLGPGFTPEQAEAALRHAGLPFRRPGSVAAAAARLLARGRVVCWCQGRMEFGPRALGSRSILADPRRPEMHGRVNRIKGREPWRPFGPSILAGHEPDWFAE
ncbi:MAG: carbamoyltransferase N-terminal domain-containing protein, partial [Elusimicrobia bacterium]|nr:carbamoyltransferase N-terminal domain-containing protein [Elusimicrobiota bacterium]